MADLPDARWRRSSFCANSSCVEMAVLEDSVVVRDSKDHQGPVLRFGKSEWTEFLSGVRNGDFDLSSDS
jgi:hypothetical protein